MKQLPNVAELGFDAVLIRPANPRVDVGMKSLPRFVDEAHENGLRVLVRAFISDSEAELHPESSPPVLALEHDADELQNRARAILATGADGVDLGLVNDQIGCPDAAANARAFSEAMQGQLAEVELAGETTILTGAILSEPRESAQRHLTEEWFHHLRDDSLVAAPWNAKEIKRRVSQAYQDRDPLGHTAAWRYSLPKWTDSPYIRSSADYGWADHSKSDQREMAMLLYTASLPGAAYIPFLHVGGGVTAKDPSEPGLVFSFEKGSRAHAHAMLSQESLLIRRKMNMGEATLAFVEGPEFCTDQTAVHLTGTIMVVLNTGKEDVVVPAEHRPLVTSKSLRISGDGGTVVRPNTCAWFQTAAFEPAGPPAYQ